MPPIANMVTKWIKSQAQASSLDSKARYEEKNRAGGQTFSYEDTIVIFRGIIVGFSKFLDRIAGLFLVAVMSLVVGNILLRVLFGKSILGTYEFVGFITAAMIGLSLAYCAIQKGHIAIGLFMDKMPPKIQHISDILINGIALIFWMLSAWHLYQYAYKMSLSGVVSPTTQMPFYYFVYIVAFGVFALSLVMLLRLIESLKMVVFTK